MTMITTTFQRAAISLATALTMVAAGSASAQQYEAPPVLDADTYLPAELLSGPNHRVDRHIINDGYMNHYTIQTKFGTFKARSNFELGVRVNEANALAAMESISGSKQFASSMAKTGGKVVQGAGNLITQPVSTIRGTFSGVGSLFQRAGDSLSEPAADTEDSSLKRATGFSTVKRDYARQFGVDVYSTNAVLQDRLDSLANATAMGGLTASAALLFVPGGAGIAVSVSKGTQLMNEADVNRPPSDLRRMNRERLEAMGVDPDMTDLFIRNTVYSPTQQTLLVDALNKMSKTADRGALVKFATQAGSDDVALFRQRQAQMYAAYNAKVTPLERFVSVGTFSAAVTGDGTMVFGVPLDYLVWTEAMANIARSATNASKGVKSLRLVTLGQVTDTARSALQSMGWEVQSDSKLITLW